MPKEGAGGGVSSNIQIVSEYVESDFLDPPIPSVTDTQGVRAYLASVICIFSQCKKEIVFVDFAHGSFGIRCHMRWASLSLFISFSCHCRHRQLARTNFSVRSNSIQQQHWQPEKKRKRKHSQTFGMKVNPFVRPSVRCVCECVYIDAACLVNESRVESIESKRWIIRVHSRTPQH